MGNANSSSTVLENYRSRLGDFDFEYLKTLYSCLFSVSFEFNHLKFKELFPSVPTYVVNNFCKALGSLKWINSGIESDLKLITTKITLEVFLRFSEVVLHYDLSCSGRAIYLLWNGGDCQSFLKDLLAYELKLYCSTFNDGPSDGFIGKIAKVERLSLMDFIQLLQKNSYLERIVKNFFLRIFSSVGSSSNSFYSLIIPPKFDIWPKFLSVEDVWMLHFHLVPFASDTWSIVYNSYRDGLSWNCFSDHIVGVGSTLVMVEDENSSLFGGFSECSWKQHTEWYGSSTNFLFQLRPDYLFYNGTTYNDHYQYFEYGTRTLPNGLGMGGQFDYFGFFIDSELAFGHSRANPLSSTYQSTVLSSSSDFKIKAVYSILVKEDFSAKMKISGHSKAANKLGAAEFLEMAGIELNQKKLGIKSMENNSDD